MIYLTIIVPVRNEEKYIYNTLVALANQDYPKERFEILVIDGRSTDKTREVVKKFIREYPNVNIRLLDNPKYLSSSARNIGIREAKGKLIAVIDGHVFIPNNKLFASMEKIKETTKALCLARPAPLDVPDLPKTKQYWIAIARKTWLGHSRNSYIYSDFEGFVDPTSSGFAYDKKVFNMVGYFDESFDAAEDVEFHFRLKKAGIMAYTSPKLLIYYYPRKTFSALFKQQARYGEGRARLVKKHPDALTKETFIPPAIFLFFAIFPLIFLCFWYLPFITISYGLLSFLYWMILLITGIREAFVRKKLFATIFIVIGIWIIHMGLGWGFLKTFISLNVLSKIKT